MGTNNKKNLLAFLLFLFSTTVFSQKKNTLSIGSKFSSNIYELSWIKVSPDQKYISFQKAYEYTSDTLALVATNEPDRIIYQTSGVYPNLLQYSKKGYLFMSGSASAKYLKLPNLEPLIWNNISKSFFLQKDNCFAMIQQGKLKIYNEDAQLINEVQEVVSMEKINDRLFYTQRKDSLYSLIEWIPNSQKILFTSASKRMVISFTDGDEYFIYYTNEETGNADFHYLNLKNHQDIALNDHLGYDFKYTSFVSKIDSNRYLITMVVALPHEQSSTVDPWYANDNNLEKKFQNNLAYKFVVWNPSVNQITYLDDATYPKQMDVGNGRFLLALNPTLNQDYTKELIQFDIYRYDTKFNKYEELGKTGFYNYLDNKGKFLLSYDNKNWVLYAIDTKEKRILNVDAEMKPLFTKEGNKIIFSGYEKIVEYDILKSAFYNIAIPKGFEATVLNTKNISVGVENRFYKYTYDEQLPLLIKIKHKQNLQQALGIYFKKGFQLLYQPTEDFVSSGTAIQGSKNYFYVKSNYNSPYVLMMNKNFVEKPIFHTNTMDTKGALVKMEKKDFTNSKGVPLKGLLYYPLDYNPQKKYPMLVGIYELLRNYGNQYLRDGFSGRVEGMNIRHFLEKGYFVYLPDIVYDDRGPGRSALDCVEASLDALKNVNAIDTEKIGLMGHSHGGYETNFIATQSNRFAAYVGGAGNSDLVRSYHSFNYDYSKPFYWQFEEQQYRMYKPFVEDKDLYINNSPIYYAEKVNKPILLWAGTNDKNIAWDQSMEFYLGLRRNKKEVIALFYKNDDHSFGSIPNREDLFVRISQWFDYHLKGVKFPWVDQMYN